MGNVEIEERYFDLGTILSVITGRMLTDLDSIYDIISYITNTKAFVDTLPSALRVTRYCILQRYPALNTVSQNIPVHNQIEAVAFVESQKPIFGETLALSPLPYSRQSNIISIDEVYRRTGKK